MDIGVSESLQTGVEGSCEYVIYGTSKNQVPRKPIKDRALLDCERPVPRDIQRYLCTCSFTSQVCPDDICCSKMVQTDVCFTPGRCRRPRMCRDNTWHQCEHPVHSSAAPNICIMSENFTQQVLSTDIGDTEETQTSLSLARRRPFSRSDPCKASSKKRGCGDREVVGRIRSMEVCDYRSPAPENAATVDACTQFCRNQILADKAVQTCSPRREVIKCYVRGQNWACRTFC